MSHTDTDRKLLYLFLSRRVLSVFIILVSHCISLLSMFTRPLTIFCCQIGLTFPYDLGLVVSITGNCMRT